MSRWALSTLMTLAMIGLASVQAQPVQPQQQLENAAERWVWDEARAGRVADLHKHCNANLDPRAGDDARWRDPCRAISAIFIERVLTQQPWRSELPFRGLRIIGAQVSEPLDLAAARISAEVWLDRSRFERGISLARAHFDGRLSLDGSTFEGGINASGLQANRGLLLRNATVRGDLVLVGAKVDGVHSLDGSTFEGGIDANGLQANRGLLLSNGATVRGDLVLVGTKIERNLETDGSTFEGRINAFGLNVSGSVFLRTATFRKTPAISFAHINGWLDLRKAELPGLDLAGTTIGELRLGDSRLPPPTWTKNAENAEQPSHLILRGTRTKVLQDRLDASDPCPDEDAWPRQLDLQGFVYEQLGTDPGLGGRDMREREACWYEKWLARDPHFAPQPYRQLASVLRIGGDPDRADAVLSAARDRERREAWTSGECGDPFKDWPWRRSDCWRAAGLGVLKVLIGYGIGGGLFLVFYWVLTFTLIGMIVLSFAPAARAKGTVWMFGASLDHLLPIVSLNKEFEDFFDDPQRQRLKGWQLSYFAVHALFGFLLGSFVVAALAGLTQTS
jgi:hypothetical protein